MKNDKFKSIRSFLKEKGYYIVLLLCAAAVGVSGYLLLKGGGSETPSVTVTQFPSEREVIATQPLVTQMPSTQEPEIRLEWKRPLDGALKKTFSAEHLAYNETTRDWRTHEGADYEASEGQTVCAAADGTVYTVYEDDDLGMTVVLQHAQGYTSHYANLDKTLSVRVGDTVRAGDALGKVGTTANAEKSAHLHFAVYLDHTPIDPETLF